jgi:hypothetical protein
MNKEIKITNLINKSNNTFLRVNWDRTYLSTINYRANVFLFNKLNNFIKCSINNNKVNAQIDDYK